MKFFFLFSALLFSNLIFSQKKIEIEYLAGKYRTATTRENYKERVTFKVVISDGFYCLDDFYDDFFMYDTITKKKKPEEFIVAVVTFKFRFLKNQRAYVMPNGVYMTKKHMYRMTNDNINKKLTCLFDFYYPCKSFYHNTENE
jgi:hypothetical protein